MEAVICQMCGVETPKRGPAGNKYCPGCSAKADLARKTAWANKHYVYDPSNNHKRRDRASEFRQKAVTTNQKSIRNNLNWFADTDPALVWSVKFAIPFDFSLSKNAIWATTGRGHIYMRQEARAKREELALVTKLAMRGQTVVEGKLWIDILVQKPGLRGDAVNVIDTVCDAIKTVVGLDDNYYSIRMLDWEISKDQPQLFIGLGQEHLDPRRVCSYCGVIKPYEEFTKSKNMRGGIASVCRPCRKLESIKD